VQGNQRFEAGTRIAGVILNNVARERHQRVLTQAIEKYCDLPVVGVLPQDDSLTIPDRHLGLIPRVENETLVPAIAAARDAVLAHFDSGRILEIAGEQGGRGERESGKAGDKETWRQGVQIPNSNLQPPTSNL
jgi:cobyrinic acid a,c-diamide synthase